MVNMEYEYDFEVVRKKILNDERLNNRDFLESREITIETGVVHNAEGSAIVTLGGTKVIAGIKAAIEKPFPDMPNKGSMGVNIERSPMADPNFENGPPSPNAIELARVVDRGIRESGAIDFEALCLVEGEKVWTIFIDITILNNEGNLLDTCSIAALAALKDTILPKVDDEFNIIKGEKDSGLKLNFSPLLFTFFKIGDKILLDADLYEEGVADARFSVAINENGIMTAMQKGIGGSFSIEELGNIVNIAKKEYKKRIKYF